MSTLTGRPSTSASTWAGDFMRTLATRWVLALAAALLLPACLEEQEAVTETLLAPSGLAAAPLPEGASIQLTWIDNSTLESGFRVDVADAPIVADSDVDEWATVPANVSVYTYASQPNTTRYFRVLAVTALNQSGPSNVASATTPNVPSAPGRLDALAGPNGSDTAVTLLWDDTSNESGYTIERSDDGANWTFLANVGANASSYFDSTTSSDESWSYRVRGINANGAGVWAYSPRAKTRDSGWDRVMSNAFGDVSWNTSIFVRFGTAYLTAYDATYGDLVATNGYVGATALFPTAINPGFPESLGYSSTSVAVRNLMYPDYVVVDAFSDTLYHLSNSTGTWVATALDSASDTDRAIVKVGPDDVLHVVYQHDAGGYKAIRHAWYSGGWNYEWLDSLMESSDYVASAVDASNGLHVVYRRALGSGQYELRYVFKPAGGSPSSTVLPTSGNPEMCSIAASPAGTAYIAYNSLSTGALRLVSGALGNWTDELIHASPRNSWGRYNAIAYESASGELHVSYIDNLYGTVRYAVKSPGDSWGLHLVDRAGGAGRFTGLDVDSEGHVFIVYGDGASQEMKLAMNAIRTPGGLVATPMTTENIWVTWVDVPNETGYRVERSEDGGSTWTTIVTNGANDTLHSDTGLSPSAEYQYRVYALNQYGESPSSNTDYAVPVYLATPSFGSSSNFGEATSVTAGSGGVLHVSHFDVTNTNTLYTTGTVGGPFSTITVDTGPAANSIIGFQGTSLTSEASGEIRIVSSHLANGSSGVLDIRFSTIPTIGPPLSLTLESTGQVGQEPRIGRASDGTLQIMHRESVIGGHRYRHGVRTGTTWTFSYATPSELIGAQYGQYFAVAPNGDAHLIYLYYATPGGPPALRHGRKSGGLWAIATLADAGTGLLYPSIALDASGFAHVVYIALPPGASSYAIMYGTNKSGNWEFETIWPSTFFSTYGQPVCAIDHGSGRIHVAYGAHNELRYARKDLGGSWVTRRVDKGANIGWISMVVDNTGMLHIAYRDEAITRLKLLSGSP